MPAAERADAARNRAKLLTAARRLVARRGVDQVTMEAVARAAGVGKGTVFHRFGNRAGEAMDGGALAEDRLEVGLGQRRRFDRAEPLAQHERAHERLLHGHLLVEREADDQRHRVRRDERIGLVGVGEVEAIGHAARS